MSRLHNTDSPAHRQRGSIILKLLSWIFLLAIVAVVYVLREPLLRTVGEFWVVEDPPEKADAIFLLGDDNYEADRATRAAEVYREGWAPRIVASGRFLRPYASIAELMQRDLTDRGVPPDAVQRMPNLAGNTREEAVLLRRLADRQHWRRVLVVTSSYHTRRTRHIYTRVFRDSADVRVIVARDGGYTPAGWWRSRTGLKIFFTESVGYLVAIWETRSTEAAQRGLNAPDAQPNPATLPAGVPPLAPARR
jgi:uncharacterized SAM-binding protein YcdF (DUF218 family)